MKINHLNPTTMNSTEKISAQVAKVRAKIAEYKAAEAEAADYMASMQYIDFPYSVERLAEIETYLCFVEKKNRIGGAVKRMARRAVELYYGCSCEWFRFEFTGCYIREFEKTFAYWN